MSAEKKQKREDELTRWARQALDAATHGLDDETRVRLRAARHRALAEVRIADTSAAGRWLAAVALAATVAALAVAVTLWVGVARNGTLPGLDDIELLAAKESPEFFADLEFYRWLAEHDHAG